MGTTRSRSEKNTAADPGPTEPETPTLDEPATYRATYGMLRAGRYIPPGGKFQAYPDDPRVLARQAVLDEGDVPTPEQAAALAALEESDE